MKIGEDFDIFVFNVVHHILNVKSQIFSGQSCMGRVGGGVRVSSALSSF